MEFPIQNRHRIKPSPATKLWARVWRDAVIEAKRREDCRCGSLTPCACRKPSDYSLSLMFQPKLRHGYSPSERLRLFENIAAYGKLPADGTHPKRRGFDIVDEVGRQSGYAWTKEIFDSPFWYLLLNPKMDAHELYEFIVLCLMRSFPKYRLPMDHISDCMAKDLGIEIAEDFFLSKDLNLSKLYEDNMPDLDNTEINLDYLAMLGALFKDAYFSGALNMALLLEKSFLNALGSVHIYFPWMSTENQNKLVILTKANMLRFHVFDDENYPDLIETYRKLAAGRAKASEIKFLKAHRERVWDDYQNPGKYS